MRSGEQLHLQPTKSGQILIFDADDTLWENNIYYEQVREKFLALTDALRFSRTEVEARIDETEQKNIKLFGYGSENFIRSLKETYAHFAGEGDHLQQTLHLIDAFGSTLYDFHIELLPGVRATLEALTTRHQIFLLTKGNPKEQADKVRKSGLESFFQAVEVVSEKDVAAYESLVQKHRLDKSTTWMIGNSPRSDINPAMEAGLGAVYIPHAVTWHFEKVPLRRGHARLLIVEQFSDLTFHF